MSRDPGAAPRLARHAPRHANPRPRPLAPRAGARGPPRPPRPPPPRRAGGGGGPRRGSARRSGIGRGTLRDLELGVHTPTRRTLKRFVEFCRARGVGPAELEEVYRLY